MTNSAPRLAPLADEEMDEETGAIVATTRGMDKRIFNVFRTLARHPKLLKRWMVFANHILFKTSLSDRARELLILRVAWLAKCEYEWGQHARIARDCGLSDDEIARIAEGPDAGWPPEEAALLRAADELRAESVISDDTWAALSKDLSEPQLLDVIFTVGNYAMLAGALNSLGVRLDEGLSGFDTGG